METKLKNGCKYKTIRFERMRAMSLPMNFLDKIQKYSIDDLELLVQTQQDVYTIEAMEAIRQTLAEKKATAENEQSETIDEDWSFFEENTWLSFF